MSFRSVSKSSKVCIAELSHSESPRRSSCSIRLLLDDSGTILALYVRLFWMDMSDSAASALEVAMMILRHTSQTKSSLVWVSVSEYRDYSLVSSRWRDTIPVHRLHLRCSSLASKIPMQIYMPVSSETSERPTSLLSSILIQRSRSASSSGTLIKNESPMQSSLEMRKSLKIRYNSSICTQVIEKISLSIR